MLLWQLWKIHHCFTFEVYLEFLQRFFDSLHHHIVEIAATVLVAYKFRVEQRDLGVDVIVEGVYDAHFIEV